MKKIFFSSPFLFTLFTHVARAVDIQLNAPIGYGGEKTPTELPQYINYLFPFAISLTAIAAVGALVVGGVLYITAGALPESVNRARSIMLDAILGMLVVIGSYLILNTINPDLVSLRTPRLIPEPEKTSERVEKLPEGVTTFPGGQENIQQGGTSAAITPSGGSAPTPFIQQCQAIKAGTSKLPQGALEGYKKLCASQGL